MTPEAPYLSIVVELENLLFADPVRCDALAKTLGLQIASVVEEPIGRPTTTSSARRSVELLIASDAELVDAEAPRRFAELVCAAAPDRVEVHILSQPGAGYYELKNAALRKARGEIGVFVDSDVVPEANWLPELVGALEDPAVEVVGGNSYIEAHSLYERAFALGWIFPLREDDGELRPARSFYANNLAFRLAVLRRFPFPRVEGTTRGSIQLLARQLRSSGIGIFRNPKARVAHPAPKRLHFFRRAIAQGRGWLLRNRAANPNSSVSFAKSVTRTRRRWRKACSRIVRHHARVELPRRQIPFALAIMTAYYGLCLVGDVMTRLAPGAMRGRFRI